MTEKGGKGDGSFLEKGTRPLFLQFLNNPHFLY
jgi:hypothetical protein